MRIGIARPFEELAEGALGPTDEERANRKLGGEATRELVLCEHRNRERIDAGIVLGIEAVEGDERYVWEKEEHAEAAVGGRCIGRREGVQKNGDGVFVTGRKVLTQSAGEMEAALHDREGVEILTCGAAELDGVEFGPGECEVVREAANGGVVEQRSEGSALFHRRGHRRKAKPGRNDGAELGRKRARGGG